VGEDIYSAKLSNILTALTSHKQQAVSRLPPENDEGTIPDSNKSQKLDDIFQHNPFSKANFLPTAPYPPSLLVDNPLSQLLLSSSANPLDFLSYTSALNGSGPLPHLFSGDAGIALSKSLPSDDDNLRNNNMAALSLLLQQQATAASLNFGLLSGANLTEHALHAAKKMKVDGAGKRKSRSSNHTKSYHCSLCSKRFSLKEELEEHVLTHTKDELGKFMLRI